MIDGWKEYPDFQIRQQAVAQNPWGHNILLLDKIKDIDKKEEQDG